MEDIKPKKLPQRVKYKIVYISVYYLIVIGHTTKLV